MKQAKKHTATVVDITCLHRPICLPWLEATKVFKAFDVKTRSKTCRDYFPLNVHFFNEDNNFFSRFHVDLAGVETNIVIMWVDPTLATPTQVK
jgi:hypothetical protein